MKTFSSMQGNANYKPYFYLSYNDSYIPVTNVRFSISSLTLEEKETYTFHPIVTPSTATNQQFTWTSSNTAVATVSNGKVTAKKDIPTAFTTLSEKYSGIKWKFVNYANSNIENPHQQISYYILSRCL